MDDPTRWIELFNAGGPWLLIGVAAWRFLKWLKPYVERIANSHTNLVDILAANDTKKTESLQVLEKAILQDSTGHKVTHDKLDEMHEDVKGILRRPKN